MQEAPEAKAVGRTARLAGFEDKKQTHRVAPIRARGPNLADIAR